MMTDPIADMITRIRNANTAYKDEVEVPASTLKEQIARVLQREGYVRGYRMEGDEPKRRIVVEMKYGPERERTITGLKRVSRPGRRVYADRGHLPAGDGRSGCGHPVHLPGTDDGPAGRPATGGWRDPVPRVVMETEEER